MPATSLITTSKHAQAQKNADDTIAILEQRQRYIEARYQAGHVTAYEKTEIQSRLRTCSLSQPLL
ncbi:MAG: hypothetical protein Q4A74_02220 [Cardiobacteriaceae bacterium]|nr:hypothetical protein [Cardiobacteriaceae bacterium]